MNKLEKVRLTDLCEVLSGGTPKTTNPDFWGGDIPWASVKDFNTGNRWFSKTDKTITTDGLKSCSSVLLQPDDLVLSARGTVGVVAQCVVPTAFNQSNYGIRAIEGVSDGDYLYYLITSLREKLLGDSHGGMFDTITRETLNRVEVPKLSLFEQQVIGRVLGYFDRKIHVNHQIASTLEQITQTIFKSWFVDFDPVHAKARGEQPVGMDAETAALFPESFEESELGPIPAGWKVKAFGDACNLVMGQSPPGDSYNSDGDGLPFYQGRTDFGDRFPSRRMYTTSGKRIANEGETLISVRAPVGDTNQATEECVIGRGVAAAIHKSGSQVFTYSLLTHLKPQLEYYNGEGTVFGAINRKDFEALSFVEPANAEISAFEKLLGATNTQIRNLHDQTTSLASLRDSLLPRLISGELEIPAELLEA